MPTPGQQGNKKKKIEKLKAMGLPVPDESELVAKESDDVGSKASVPSEIKPVTAAKPEVVPDAPVTSEQSSPVQPASLEKRTQSVVSSTSESTPTNIPPQTQEIQQPVQESHPAPIAQEPASTPPKPANESSFVAPATPKLKETPFVRTTAQESKPVTPSVQDKQVEIPVAPEVSDGASTGEVTVSTAPIKQMEQAQPSTATDATAQVTDEEVEVVDELLEDIEEIMTEDLEEEFEKMSPTQQKKFKEEGEEAASNIRDMLKKSKIKVKKIIKLLIDWLKLIPGINKFFLIQEAKIKADQILDLKDEKEDSNE